MSRRATLYFLLAIVATAAAILSFAALRDLALVCGFAPGLAWLFPAVVDAGAGAGSVVWLGGHGAAAAARRFARGLALGLLTLSVAANALGHGLAAYGLAPAWWVVVVVSATAPAVLGAVVHLVVLVGREPRDSWGVTNDPALEADRSEATTALGLVPVDETAPLQGPGTAPPPEAASYTGPSTHTAEGWRAFAYHLIDNGLGRKRLMRELDISEYEARQLLAQHATVSTQTTNGHQEVTRA